MDFIASSVSEVKKLHISQNSPQRVKCRPTTILQSLVSWLSSFRFFTTFFLGSLVNAEYPATLTTWLKNSGYAVCGINSFFSFFFLFSKNEEITCVTHTFILEIYFSLKEYIFDITCISYCVPPGGGGVLRLIFAGYVPLASQSPCRSHFSHFWANVIFAIPT